MMEPESYPFPTLPEYLAPGLKLVFVGINPAVYAVQRGHYYTPADQVAWYNRLADYLDQMV